MRLPQGPAKARSEPGPSTRLGLVPDFRVPPAGIVPLHCCAHQHSPWRAAGRLRAEATAPRWAAQRSQGSPPLCLRSVGSEGWDLLDMRTPDPAAHSRSQAWLLPRLSIPCYGRGGICKCLHHPLLHISPLACQELFLETQQVQSRANFLLCSLWVAHIPVLSCVVKDKTLQPEAGVLRSALS